MSYIRKTTDEYQLLGLYSGEWEILTYEYTFRDARLQLKTYKENEPQTTYKIKKVRIPISEELKK